MAERITRNRKEKWQFAAEKLGEKLFDLGNIVAGTMVFGQFLSDKPFNTDIALFGLAILIFLYGSSIMFLVKVRR